MKHRLKMFLKLISYCGLFNGLSNQLKLTLGFTNNIKLKGIKYPFKLRKHTSDKATFEQVFLNKEYDLDFIKNLKIIIDG